MIYLPFNDPEASYRLVKEFAGKKGVCGFMVTSVRYKPVHHNSYMKIYSLIEETGLPLAFHAGYNWNEQSMAMMNKFISVHALGFVWYNMVHMTNWVLNALPERFPKLKVIWIESGLAWLPFMIQRLDNEYMMRSSECPGLKKLPGEYITDMFYTSQPMEIPRDMSLLEATFKCIKAESQLLYSSDYPHWDFDLPSTIYDLPFLKEKAKRDILGGNAVKLFKLDINGQEARQGGVGEDRHFGGVASFCPDSSARTPCRAISSRMNLSNFSGVFSAAGGGAMPSSAIRFLNASLCTTSLRWVLRKSMIGFGVLAGAASPTKPR